MPDYETEQDGIRIAEAFKELPVLTGGSGLLPYVLENDALLIRKKIRHGNTGGRFCYVEAVRLLPEGRLRISESIMAAVIL